MVWTLVVIGGGTVPEPTQIFGVLAVIFAQRLATTENDGWAFVASGFAIAAAIGQLFISLYPNVMVSSTNHAYNLTVNNAAAGHYGAGRDDRRRGAVLPDRAALPGLVVPRVPPARERAADVVGLGGERCAPWTRACSAARKPVRPLLVVDSALGIATALAVLLGATMLARIAARAFARRLAAQSLARVRAAGRRVRGTRGVRVGDGGRRAGAPRGACSRSFAWRSWSGGLRTQPAALDGAGAAEITAVSVQGVEALEGYFARYLPQVVLASIVPFLVIAWVAFLDLEAAVIMLLTLPLVPVFMWLIGTYTEDATRERWQALRRLSTPFPRRRAGPADAAGVRPGS